MFQIVYVLPTSPRVCSHQHGVVGENLARAAGLDPEFLELAAGNAPQSRPQHRPVSRDDLPERQIS